MFVNVKSGNTCPVRYELHIEGQSSEVRNAQMAEALRKRTFGKKISPFNVS